MKILHSKTNGSEASVLLMTVVVTGIVGFLLIAYLTLVKSQNYSTFRSQAWNNAIPVIEAGIEDALAHLNKENGTNDLIGDGGWEKTGSIYHMKRYVGESYYIVTISNYVINATNVLPVVESRAYVTMPVLVASAQNYLFAQVNGTPTTTSYLARGVRVKAKQERLFSKGMVADGEIDLNGNRITTDSFNSTDTNYNTGGKYDINKRRANGDIASNVGLTNSAAISSDNAKIYGRMSTGPQGSVDIGPNGSVGDLAWHAAGNKGIKPGYLKDDMNVDFSTVPSPSTSGSFSINGTSATINGTNYDYVLSGGSGALYAVDELQLNNQTMLIQGNVCLYIQNDLAISGSGLIEIAPGATLNLYVAAPTATLGGNGVINAAGSALSFTYWGLPSNTQLTLSGNSDFIGLIYAPQADFFLNGGGGITYFDFSGASITKTVKMGGNYNFHYDEALRTKGPPKGFIVTSWDEMTPAEVAAAPVN